MAEVGGGFVVLAHESAMFEEGGDVLLKRMGDEADDDAWMKGEIPRW